MTIISLKISYRDRSSGDLKPWENCATIWHCRTSSKLWCKAEPDQCKPQTCQEITPQTLNVYSTLPSSLSEGSSIAGSASIHEKKRASNERWPNTVVFTPTWVTLTQLRAYLAWFQGWSCQRTALGTWVTLSLCQNGRQRTCFSESRGPLSWASSLHILLTAFAWSVFVGNEELLSYFPSACTLCFSIYRSLLVVCSPGWKLDRSSIIFKMGFSCLGIKY